MIQISKLLALKYPLILASKSPRRKNLLENLGFEFEIHNPTTNEEDHPLNIEPSVYVSRLALEKAMDISKKTKIPSIVIGADTIVFLDGKILNKPNNRQEAKLMLQNLSGATHTVYTGVALVFTGKLISRTSVQETKVTFRELDENEIDAYIETGSPLDKAGGYGIQDDFGAVFVSHIEGCYYNIVGLPLELFYQNLKQLIKQIS